MVYHSLSYGGTYIPHVLDIMAHRNRYGDSDRIRKHIDHVFLTNPFSDIMTHMCVSPPCTWIVLMTVQAMVPQFIMFD
jgi:hypothetical protein